MYRKNKKAWYKHYDFMFLDLICMELSFVLALCVRFGNGIIHTLLTDVKHSEIYYQIMLMILGLHIAMVLFVEPYSGILRRNAAEEIKAVVGYDLIMTMGIIALLFAMQTSQAYSRIVLFIFPVINGIIMMIYRYFYKRYLRKQINKSTNQDCMLLVAPYGQVRGILQKFYKKNISTIRIVGIVVTDESLDEVAVSLEDGQIAELVSPEIGDFVQNIPIVGNLHNLYEFARTNVVDEVLICLDNEHAEQIAEEFIAMGITVHVSIQSLVQIPKATINKVNGIPVITASVNTITVRQLVVKRLIDIALGLIGTIVTLLLTMIIAPAIWIADPGPIFFRQERVGKNGRTFKIWKFRTMYKDAEARKAELMAQNKMSGLMFKMDDDPRIIGYGKKFSLGKFLRESSLDEFPQSFNILTGSMSVVGTRPPTVKEYEQYELHHKGRLATKPGLTGMWQVSGRSDITDFEEVVRLDKEYIDNFSLALDLEIMLKTFKVVLGKEGSV